MLQDKDEESLKRLIISAMQDYSNLENKELKEKLENSLANQHMYKTVSDEYLQKFSKAEEQRDELLKLIEKIKDMASNPATRLLINKYLANQD